MITQTKTYEGLQIQLQRTTIQYNISSQFLEFVYIAHYSTISKRNQLSLVNFLK